MNLSYIKDYLTVFLLLHISFSKAYQSNSRFLGPDNAPEERRLGNRRRPGSQGPSPCSFGGGYGRPPKKQGVGRTFFDLQYLNLEHNYNLEINCGGGGGYHPQPVPAPHNDVAVGGGGHKPLGHNKPSLGQKPIGLGGLHDIGEQKPHRPLGGHHRPSGGGGFFQGLFGGGGNKPYGQGDTQASQSDEGPFNGAFAGILPSPHQVGTGLSEGIQGFIGTLPAIGQSFQSILPSFSDFQWPQLPQLPQLPFFNRPEGNTGPAQFGPVFQGAGSGPVPVNPFNRPPVAQPVTTVRPIIATSTDYVTPAPITTTIDPDDIIYSDELKPVHEDYDPITDPYSTKPAGPEGKYRPNRYYSRHIGNQYQSYRRPTHEFYRNNENYYRNAKSNQYLSGRNSNNDGSEGRSFRFPS